MRIATKRSVGLPLPSLPFSGELFKRLADVRGLSTIDRHEMTFAALAVLASGPTAVIQFSADRVNPVARSICRSPSECCIVVQGY
jgi:hypothetical protein